MKIKDVTTVLILIATACTLCAEDLTRALWRDIHNISEAEMLDNADGDIYDNEQEAVMGLDPTVNDSPVCNVKSTDADNGTAIVEIPVAVIGKQYDIEFSIDLINWEATGTQVVGMDNPYDIVVPYPIENSSAPPAPSNNNASFITHIYHLSNGQTMITFVDDSGTNERYITNVSFIGMPMFGIYEDVPNDVSYRFFASNMPFFPYLDPAQNPLWHDEYGITGKSQSALDYISFLETNVAAILAANPTLATWSGGDTDPSQTTYPVSAIFYRLVVDSSYDNDWDGLPDWVEAELGFSSQFWDTDGDGVDDFTAALSISQALADADTTGWVEPLVPSQATNVMHFINDDDSVTLVWQNPDTLAASITIELFNGSTWNSTATGLDPSSTSYTISAANMAGITGLRVIRINVTGISENVSSMEIVTPMLTGSAPTSGQASSTYVPVVPRPNFAVINLGTVVGTPDSTAGEIGYPGLVNNKGQVVFNRKLGIVGGTDVSHFWNWGGNPSEIQKNFVGTDLNNNGLIAGSYKHETEGYRVAATSSAGASPADKSGALTPGDMGSSGVSNYTDDRGSVLYGINDSSDELYYYGLNGQITCDGNPIYLTIVQEFLFDGSGPIVSRTPTRIEVGSNCQGLYKLDYKPNSAFGVNNSGQDLILIDYRENQAASDVQQVLLGGSKKFDSNDSEFFHPVAMNDAGVFVGRHNKKGIVYYDSSIHSLGPRNDGGVGIASPPDNTFPERIAGTYNLYTQMKDETGVYIGQLLKHGYQTLTKDWNNITIKHMSDDGNFVAGTATQTGSSTVKGVVMFEVGFKERATDDGFDDKIYPTPVNDEPIYALMVPEAGTNRFKLVLPADLTNHGNVNVVSQNQGIAKVSWQPYQEISEIQIEGIAKGTVYLDLEVNGQVVFKNAIEINCKKERSLKAIVYYVNLDTMNDGIQNGVADITVGDVPTVSELKTHLNDEAWGRQANVVFDTVTDGGTIVFQTSPLHAWYRFQGVEGSYSNPGADDYKLKEVTPITVGATTYDMVLIYIADLVYYDGQGDPTSGLAGITAYEFNRCHSNGSISNEDFNVMAHEIGHELGINKDETSDVRAGDGHSFLLGDLMADDVDNVGPKIRRYDWQEGNEE